MNSTKILNQRVDLISPEKTFSLITQSIDEKKPSLFFALNTNILLQLHRNPSLKEIHEKQARVIFLDGVPLIWLINLFTKNKLSRVAGTDLTEKILLNQKSKVFILGSSKSVLQKAKEKYPNIAGIYSPPFNNQWLKKEKNKIISLIKKSKANTVLVAVGPLKQEQWLLKNFSKTNCFVGIGVGSAIDILVGTKPRAPKILRDNGFEWLWRIILEPRRLFKRYLIDFFRLVKLIFLAR